MQRVLQSDTVEVTDWRVAILRGGLMGADVYRVSGTALDGRLTRRWALIVKVARPKTGWGQWRREGLALSSGLLSAVSGGLVAPQCFAVSSPREDEQWLWLEEIRGPPATQWSRQRLILGSRHLGQFNGAFLGQRELPSADWLARRVLEAWIARLAPEVQRLRAELALGRVLVGLGWPPDVRSRLHSQWHQREALVAALQALPQTLCHHDANPRNLISRHTPKAVQQTVAVDWAMVGIGPVGYDIVPLCGELLPSFRFGIHEARRLTEEIFAGYLAGLRDAGWRGSREIARFGFTAGLSLRYGVCGGPANIADLLDERLHAIPERRWGRPLEQIMARWAESARFMLDLGDEAHELLRHVSCHEPHRTSTDVPGL